jgi:hypothetical protein
VIAREMHVTEVGAVIAAVYSTLCRFRMGSAPREGLARLSTPPVVERLLL